MVLNRKIGDSNNAEIKFKTHQRLLEMSTTTGRRWNLSGVGTHRESVIGVPTSSTKLPTSSSEPTTHQKIHRIIEEHAWKSKSRNNITSAACALPNYTIVASRGELSRGSFAIRESSPNEFIGSSSRRRSPCGDCQFVNCRYDDLRSGREQKHPWERRKDGERSNSRSRIIRSSISKSSSVPANLKEVTALDSPVNTIGYGILKRSSVLLGRFAGEKKTTSLLKKKSSISGTNRVQGVVTALRKSPSCHTLSADVRRDFKSSSCRSVKKSVSFSLDTSFGEKKTTSKKTPDVHEAKVYRKGVLQDINSIEKTVTKTLEVHKETMSQALLRAARDADDLALSELITRIRRSGFDHVDVNATDLSGRSAISYIAGNGHAETLQIVLSFPGANPNLADNEGNTPLHFAAQAGQAECLNILLQRSRGIEIDARNVLGFTSLMKAALQGRTKCAKILLFAGANPTLRDHGRGLRADLWAKYCGRHVCAEVIERFSRHKLMEKTACRWGSEPELATKVLQGKIIPVPTVPMAVSTSGFKSRFKRVFKSTSSDKTFSLVSQLTSAALCASTPALPKPGDMPPVKSLIRPLSVPQLRVTLAASTEINDRNETMSLEKLESTIVKPPRVKKKNK